MRSRQGKESAGVAGSFGCTAAHFIVEQRKNDILPDGIILLDKISNW